MQFRYVLPMVALMGACWRSRRAAPGGAGVRSRARCIVSLVLAHDLFSQLLVISRYYG